MSRDFRKLIDANLRVNAHATCSAAIPTPAQGLAVTATRRMRWRCTTAETPAQSTAPDHRPHPLLLHASNVHYEQAAAEAVQQRDGPSIIVDTRRIRWHKSYPVTWCLSNGRRGGLELAHVAVIGSRQGVARQR
jgi:hypothetical protein